MNPVTAARERVLPPAAPAAPPPAPPRARRAPEAAWALGTIAVAGAGYGFVARAGAPAAGGLLGHGLGIAGFLLMLFAQVGYSWRKRTSRSGPGPVHRWMQAHVYAGLVGPFLVLLHSAFEFRGVAGIAALLMGIVVLSGIMGRFVYGSTERVLEPEGQWAHWNPRRRWLSLWYALHVPLALSLIALATVHVLGALYYATLLK